MKETMKYLSAEVRRKLGVNPASPVRILKIMWNWEFCNILDDIFQFVEYEFDKEPTLSMLSKFPEVVLKKCF